jgi:FMN phosphatase YigB (HAD superfamily)
VSIDPGRVVFIDDRPENVRGAEAVGVKGIVVPTPADVVRNLQPLMNAVVKKTPRLSRA